MAEGKAYLKQASTHHSVHAFADTRNKHIKLYGSFAANIEFKKAISKFLRKLPPFIFKIRLLYLRVDFPADSALAHVAAALGREVSFNNCDNSLYDKEMTVSGTVQDAELAKEILTRHQ